MGAQAGDELNEPAALILAITPARIALAATLALLGFAMLAAARLEKRVAMRAPGIGRISGATRAAAGLTLLLGAGVASAPAIGWRVGPAFLAVLALGVAATLGSLATDAALNRSKRAEKHNKQEHTP